MKDNQDYHIADAISFAEMEGLDRLHEEDEALIANVAGDVETQADLTEITRYQALEIKDSRKKQFAQNPNHEIDKGPLTAFKGQALALHTGKWETDENGIWKLTKRGELILVCHQQLTIEGILVNRKTGIEKVVLAFREGGTWNRITVPRHVAQSNSAIVKLADRGLAVSSVNASSVVSYLYALLTLNQEIIPRINGAFHLGWQNGGFIPYTGEDGFDGEACFKSLFESVSRKGSKDVWLKSMKEMRDNMIIRLATSASVASALIEPLDAQVFLLHIWGVSEINRPVALTAAASIWGNPKWDNLVFLMNNSLSYFIKVACVLKNIPFFGDRMDLLNEEKGESYDRFIESMSDGFYNEYKKGIAETSGAWRNAIITSGKERITQNCSRDSSKRRVIEVHMTGQNILNELIDIDEILTQNYGWLGEIITNEIIAKLPEIKARYTELNLEFEKIFESRKSAALAAIVAADELLCPHFNEKPLELIKWAELLKEEEEVDAEQAYAWTLKNIAASISQFVTPSRKGGALHGETLGRIGSDSICCYKIAKLEARMKDAGFILKDVLPKWVKKGYAIQHYEGGKPKFGKTVRIVDACARCVLIKMPPDFEV